MPSYNNGNNESSDKCNKMILSVPPQSVYVHLNPTEINFDTATMWWLREFISCTMTEDFKLMVSGIQTNKETHVFPYS